MLLPSKINENRVIQIRDFFRYFNIVEDIFQVIYSLCYDKANI